MRRCTIKKCKRKHYGKNLCQKHYGALHRSLNKAQYQKYYTSHHEKSTSRFRDAKYRAAKRKLFFTLTLNEYEVLIKLPCYYCSGFFGHVYRGVGLDRINNSIGYELNNVLPCCGTCNVSRGDKFTPDEFKAGIKAIIRRRVRTSLTKYPKKVLIK